MADQAVGKTHNAVGNAAMQHQFARKDKKRNGKKGKNLHASHHLLEYHGHWQARSNDGGDR